MDEKFWAKVEPTGFCWNWTASKNALGYGRINRSGRTGKAHRYAYEELVGTIPEGLELDHLCMNPSCVNPDHLEPVTHKENMRRAKRGGPVTHRAKTHCPHGHPYAGANLYERKGGRWCRTCAARRVVEHRARRRALVE